MSWSGNGFGVDFRSTSGYVTDPSYCVFESGADTYPTSATNGDGVNTNIGWNVAVGGFDRVSTNDARIAGINLTTNGTPSTFRIDLPATGAYTIDAAFGDYNNNDLQQVEFQDNGVTFATIANVGNNFGWVDASGVQRTSNADWVANHATISHTFTSTIFQLVAAYGANNGNSTYVAHVRLIQQAAADTLMAQGSM